MYFKKEKLLFLYQNKKELSLMGKKAEHKAKNFFSWKNYGEKIKNFLVNNRKKIILSFLEIVFLPNLNSD